MPTAHDEPALGFHLYADAFDLPRALLCNTPEEATLIAQRFPHAARRRVVGVGIDALPGDPRRFPHARGRPYLLYVGRLEAGKGLDALLSHHARLTREDPYAPELLLAGGGELTVKQKNVRTLGRITEQEKFDGLAGAVAAVVPSRYESLSLLALEAFASGAPVIGNAESAVIAGHLKRSGAGFAFSDAAGYVDAVKNAAAQRATLAKKATAYARRFRWPKVVEAYLEEISRIRKGS